MIAVLATGAQAAPTTVTNAPASSTNLPAPNTTGGVGTVTMSGKSFTNQGMVGAARYTATGRDFNNDTLGSFSGMTFLRDTWRRDATTGQYSGGMLTLPDRGPNFALTGFPGNFFSNYNGRLNGWNFTFNPYTGAALPQSTASQNQVTLTPNGGFFFRDFTGNAFTGLEPGSNTFTQNGFTFGGPASGLGAGKISFDPEAVAIAIDGTYWVSDEYQAGIFHFSASGDLIGYIPATPAITPRVGGVVNFTTADAVAGQTGRRLNQGLEGLTITPDGKTLWVMLQSATLQDSTLGNDALRNTTRLIGYNIAGGTTPTNPIAEYVMELPVFNRGATNGTVAAGASNRTAAQSEILALNGTQFLVLSRDGNGLGNDPTVAVGNDGRPPVYKSVLLIDTAGATNINGTTRQTTAGGTVTTGPGIIDPAITPVQQVQLVNLINATELARFGMNLTTGAGTNATTISEKWEAMGLLPTLEEDKPQDVFLFVGNDNDFQTTNGQINGSLTNGTDVITTYNSGFVNDNMFMVYRLTLPTYVDTAFLQSMIQTAPVTMAVQAESSQSFGGYAGLAIDAHLDSGRQAGAGVAPGAYGAWLVGSFADIDPVVNGQTYTAEALNGTAGLELGLTQHLTGGVAVSVLSGKLDVNGGIGHDIKSAGISAYASYVKGGLFSQLSFSYSRQSFDNIERAAAYGLTAHGETNGTTQGVSGKAGYLYDIGNLKAGPVIGGSWITARIDGYTETGAAGGNVTYPKHSFDRWSGSLGFEATVQAEILPTFHAYYTLAQDSGNDVVSVSLASAQNIMGTQSISVPVVAGDTLTLGLGVQGTNGRMRWHAGYDADIGVENGDDLTHRVTAGVSLGF